MENELLRKVILLVVAASPAAVGQRRGGNACPQLFADDAGEKIEMGFAALDGHRSRYDFTLFSVSLPPASQFLSCRGRLRLSVRYRRLPQGKWEGEAVNKDLMRRGGNVTVAAEPCSTYRFRLRAWMKGKGVVWLELGEVRSGPAEMEALRVDHGVAADGRANEMRCE